MEGFFRDVRFTGRNMGRSPAIFSFIRAVMVKSLPVQDRERLVLLDWHGDEWPRGLNQSGSGGPNNPAYKNASRSQAYPFFRQLAAQTDLFDSVFAFAPLGSDRRNVTLAADNAAERVDGEMVSGAYFRGLGVPAAAGRLIAADDERGAAQVAVRSYPFWSRRFGADAAIVGRQVTINSLPFTVIGVASPRDFHVRAGRSAVAGACRVGRAGGGAQTRVGSARRRHTAEEPPLAAVPHCEQRSRSTAERTATGRARVAWRRTAAS